MITIQLNGLPSTPEEIAMARQLSTATQKVLRFASPYGSVDYFPESVPKHNRRDYAVWDLRGQWIVGRWTHGHPPEGRIFFSKLGNLLDFYLCSEPTERTVLVLPD